MAWSWRLRKRARRLCRIEIARDATAHIVRRILLEGGMRRKPESDLISGLPSEYERQRRWENVSRISQDEF
jgi:hypothetical protein